VRISYFVLRIWLPDTFGMPAKTLVERRTEFIEV
jgi:hypothetical protein